MSSAFVEVRLLLLLSALTLQVQGCREQLSVEDVGNALHGLQGMSSDHKKVLSLLRALTPEVQECWGQLSACAGNRQCIIRFKGHEQ